MCGMCGARITPIPSQRARACSVGKTPSFIFCLVDIVCIRENFVRITTAECLSNRVTQNVGLLYADDLAICARDLVNLLAGETPMHGNITKFHVRFSFARDE